jgi:hypothetical protein
MHRSWAIRRPAALEDVMKNVSIKRHAGALALLFACMLLDAFSSSCAASPERMAGGTGTDMATLLVGALPAIAHLASATYYPPKAMGKDYLVNAAHDNCAVFGDLMTFSPSWDSAQHAGLDGAAYCMFGMGANTGTADATLTLVWTGAAPAEGAGWLAISDFAHQRWEWRRLDGAVLNLTGVQDYVDAGDNVYAAVVLLGATQLSLNNITLSGGGGGGGMNIEQTISDGAQRTTLAFDGLALITGNLQAQSFFPPGKVADYTGFQYLRDNDPDSMGHNTSFLTRVAANVIYILNDAQFAQLKTLAISQMSQIDLYGYQRYPLMKAFRRLIDNDIPAGSTGLNLNAVEQASADLYELDGQISFDRAMLYVAILNSMDATQKAYIDAMKGKGWSSWPDIGMANIDAKMKTLPQGTSVAVMTYASDLYSWYAGSVEADVYFCPERQGTYYGGFYIKDAPAIGHEGYSIDEQLTATAGAALSDSSKGYVTDAQATLMSSLVETQRDNLYAGATNIVDLRTQIATLLRGLLVSTDNSDAVKAQVLALSRTYGELDGENNYYYATVFNQVYESLSADQLTKLADLRHSILSGTYDDGTPFDFTTCTTYYLYSAAVSDERALEPYVADTDYLFFEP